MVQSLDLSDVQSLLSNLLRKLGDDSSADESDMHASYGEDVAGVAVALTALERHGWLEKAPTAALETAMRTADDYGDKETVRELSRELKRRGGEIKTDEN